MRILPTEAPTVWPGLAVASQWTSRCSLLPRQVWHEITDLEGTERLVGLGAKSESGIRNRMQAAAGIASDCAPRSFYVYKPVRIYPSWEGAAVKCKSQTSSHGTQPRLLDLNESPRTSWDSS